jgi:hypothetical protein
VFSAILVMWDFEFAVSLFRLFKSLLLFLLYCTVLVMLNFEFAVSLFILLRSFLQFLLAFESLRSNRTLLYCKIWDFEFAVSFFRLMKSFSYFCINCNCLLSLIVILYNQSCKLWCNKVMFLFNIKLPLFGLLNFCCA